MALEPFLTLVLAVFILLSRLILTKGLGLSQLPHRRIGKTRDLKWYQMAFIAAQYVENQLINTEVIHDQIQCRKLKAQSSILSHLNRNSAAGQRRWQHL